MGEFADETTELGMFEYMQHLSGGCDLDEPCQYCEANRRMMMPEIETPEPGLTCPRCKERSVPPGKPLCSQCQDEENEQAGEEAAGQEDAKTAADARKADAQQKAQNGQAPPATNGQQQTKPNTRPAPAQRQQRPAAGRQAPPATNGQQQRPAQQPQQAAQQPPPARRMTLAAVKTNAAAEEPRLLLYGTEGIGKSTLAADAEDPVFVPGGKSPNIQRPMFPVPETFKDVIDAIDELTNSDHKFKTVVFDDFDYVEGLVWDYAIEQYNKTNPKVRATSIEDVGGGYGKGYQAAVDVFRKMLPRLERLREKKQMQVIFICHALVKTHKNPTGNDYDRFVCSMHEKAVSLFRRWCDAMLFCNYVDTLRHDWRARKTFAEGNGARIMYTQRRPTHDAKNRYDLPFEMPMPLENPLGPLREGIARSRDPKVLRSCIEEKLGQVTDEAITSWVRAQLALPALPTDKLSRINARLTEKIEEQEEAAIAAETDAGEIT